ncbi:hypothetical protein M9H77_31717 [Catharanthus roseus]|uniref:Uncharacterized protein n=1 Tax=Catharanthus roseus TaxID=4058 RepID=A0ACC0A2Q4_CATRO|nr:hypothetical protein M9H77_31717 [Catharanthus roseus]
MCHPVISYDFSGNKMWVVLSVPRKYITSLRRLRSIGCRGKTQLKKFLPNTRPISKVREMRHLAKGVLSPVLLEDPSMTLTSHPEIHLRVPHSLIQTLSFLSFILSSAIGRTWLVMEIVGIRLWHILCSVMNHAMNIYLSLLGSVERVHELVHRTQWQDGPALLEYWLETPDSLYVIVNAFNLCVVLISQLGSTTVLPLYSYSNRPGGSLVIGLLTKQQHFIQLQMHDECLIPPLHVQWIYHRGKRVSNWEDSYYERIED